MLRSIRSAAETLHGEGYSEASEPTQAALDIRFLLAHFDRPRLNPEGCAISVMHWLQAMPYRSVVHKSDGSYVALDEGVKRFMVAATMPLLADVLMNWKQEAETYAPAP